MNWTNTLVAMQMATFGLVGHLWMVQMGRPKERGAAIAALMVFGAILVMAAPTIQSGYERIVGSEADR